MTTAQSPLWRLKMQADKIAAILKSDHRQLAAARAKNAVTFGVAMDDKIVKVTMPWTTVDTMSKAQIAAYIVSLMRGGPQ